MNCVDKRKQLKKVIIKKLKEQPGKNFSGPRNTLEASSDHFEHFRAENSVLKRF